MTDKEDHSFGELFQKLFYSKTNEKLIVTKLLNEKLADQRFTNALDVGAGPGEITAVLDKIAKNLTIVEANPFYEKKLRSRFPKASLVIQDIRNVELKPIFDFILLNQVLYFIPANEWIKICTKLMRALRPTGELVIIMNDHHIGDLKRIFEPNFDRLKPYLSWEYLPLNELISNLRGLGWEVTPTSYQYRVTYDSETEVLHALQDVFFGFRDATAKASNEFIFENLTQSFKQPDGKFVINMDAKIMAVRKSYFKAVEW